METETIRAKKFMLRTPKMSDAKSLSRHLNNWKIIKFLSQLPFPYAEKDARNFLGKMLKEMKKEKPHDYVMIIEIDGESVGSIGLHGIVHGHKAEAGYWLAEKYWGQGIVTEALEKFMKHAFAKFKLKRIFAFAYDGNEGSVRVMEKVGMKFEGVAKKYALKDGKYIDCHIYAKIK